MADDFEDLADDLEELGNRAEELTGENDVPISELFDPSFMKKYTEFDSLDEFFQESPWTVETEDDLDEIPDGPFNEYVREHTMFSNQEDMMGTATEEWVGDQLGL